MKPMILTGRFLRDTIKFSADLDQFHSPVMIVTFALLVHRLNKLLYGWVEFHSGYRPQKYWWEAGGWRAGGLIVQGMRRLS